MKRNIIILLIILIIPISLYASTPISDFPAEKNIKVLVDYSSIQNASAVSFTTNSVASMQKPGDYKAYDSLTGLSGNIVIAPANNEMFARSPKDLYLSWKIYSPVVLDIFLRLDGPLSAGAGKPTINWKLSVVKKTDGVIADTPDADGTVMSIGSDQHAEFDYSTPGNSKICVHSTDSKFTGYSGSCHIAIATESLLGFAFETYTAKLYADIVTRE